MTTPHRNNKPELLAPAGSIESFHAAVEAGADAVYLGLDDFNARLRAKNFSTKTLSYLVPFAHEHRVKLYVTLNTLIKQAEIPPLIHTLYQLEQIGVDAIIVADSGLIDIARIHFPKLRLHASTQMTIHNSAGIRSAEQLGIRRVILSRELTLEEIGSLCGSSKVEVEIFVHGALCYSISGLCLASSFLGGSSGNRGRCTQVCRRKFKTAGTEGYFFSPRDLGVLELLPRIAACGVKSLKIEGRMKGPEYVYAVVRAWRMALDDSDNLPAAEDIAAHDFGRPKTSFFFNGPASPGIIDATRQSGVGEPVGTILEVRHDTITVAAAMPLFANDRLRIQPHDGFEGESATVRNTTAGDGTTVITLKKPVSCSARDTVYLIGRDDGDARYNQMRGAAAVLPVAYKPLYPNVNKIAARPCFTPAAKQRETLWFRIDDAPWLDLLHATPCQRLMFAGDRAGMNALLRDDARLRTWRSRLVLCLPPFVPEKELPLWRTLIDRFKNAGVTAWSCSNIGHRALFDKGYSLIADAPLACLNGASQNAVLSRGFSFFTYSREDDYLNIKAAASPYGLVYLFGSVPLFISRIHPAVKPEIPLCDPHQNRFIVKNAHGLHYLLAEKPLCLTHRLSKLSELGIRNFIMDLSFRKVDPGFLQTIIACYKNGTRLPDSSVFNFKAGLK
jgi:U32 family peptidase